MSEIWIIKNKKYIISELKDTISDVEDEHDSTPIFFQRLKERIQKWEELWKQEKEAGK